MELVVVAVVAVAAIAALVVIHRQNARSLRDELTANRMERAELMQRIQAPQAATAQHFYGGQPVPYTEPEIDPEIIAEQEWAASDESLIPFDDDLQFEATG